jgi:hypothetical protein
MEPQKKNAEIHLESLQGSLLGSHHHRSLMLQAKEEHNQLPNP